MVGKQQVHKFRIEGGVRSLSVVFIALLFSSLSIFAQDTVQTESPLLISGETNSTGGMEWLQDRDVIVTTEGSRLVASQPDGEEIEVITISSNNAIATDVKVISDELLAVGVSDGNVCFVDLESWQISNCVQVSDEGVKRITISRDATSLGVIDDNNLYVYAIDYERMELTLEFHTGMSYLLDFILFNDGVGFSGGMEGVIRIWDIVGKQEYDTLGMNQEAAIYDLDFSFDSSILASAHYMGVSLWNIRTRERMIDLGFEEGSLIWSIAFNPSDTQLATGSARGTVELWNLASNDLIASWRSVDAGITHIAYSSDGRFLAARYDNNLVQIWNTETLS
jgi:WD40 repeat protein